MNPTIILELAKKWKGEVKAWQEAPCTDRAEGDNNRTSDLHEGGIEMKKKLAIELEKTVELFG